MNKIHVIIEVQEGGADLKELSPLERAIEYIESHLNEDIGLGDVSRETGYSYYHMTRLFSAVLGESVGHYINRRRLYNASEALIRTDRRVIDIALDSGFESSEAFSRAFKAAFGSSPAEYRRAGLDLVVNAKRELSPEDVGHIANNITHSPEIRWTEDMQIAGLRGATTRSDNQIPGLWQEFLRVSGGALRTRGGGYEICETQQTTYTKDGDVSFSVLVGAPAASFTRRPEGLVERMLRGGRYAVFTHRGTFANLFKTYQYIFGTWLATAKETLDDREDYALYEREVTAFDDPDNVVKIFIPIR